MKLVITSKGTRLPGETLERRHKKSERLLPDTTDFKPLPKRTKPANWIVKTAKKRWSQLAHFLFEDSLVSVLLGISVACISFCVDISYEYLHYVRRTVFEMASDTDWFLGLLFWTGFTTSLVALAALTCKYISKEAIGSGIPNIRVICDGFMLARYFSARTLFAKIVGLVFTVGSGLPVGKEGPFIHIGAILAKALSTVSRKINGHSIISHQGKDIQNILSGCAVGIACTFNAPVGAVLYAIECTSRFSAVRNLWRSFLSTTCAALVFKYANVFLVPENIGDTILAYYETHLPNEVYVVAEIPLFIIFGAACGIMGAAFVAFYRLIYAFRKHNRIYRSIFGNTFNISFTVFVAFVVSLITFPDGFGKYVGGQWTLREQLSDFISNCTMSDFTAVGHCSDDLIYRWTSETSSPFVSLASFFVVNFLLVTICTGLAVPASIFVPTFVIGACGGRIVGEALHVAFPHGIGETPIYPGLYAIVGAAAFTGAVTHSISIAVIVCEATGQLSTLLPVLIALMTATTVSGLLQPSIYDVIVRLKNYPHLNDLPPNRAIVHELSVENFMRAEPVFLSQDATYLELRKLLIDTPDIRAYPLINNKEEKILLGSVGRRYLHVLLLRRLGPDPSMMGQAVTVLAPNSLRKRNSTSNLQNVVLNDRNLSGNTLLSTSPLHQDFDEKRSPLAPLLRRQTLHDIKDIASQHKVNGKKLQLSDHIELDPEAIEPTPCQLVRGTSLYKVHNLFSLLGLQHAYVTDRGRLIGVVSFNELREVVNNIYAGTAFSKYLTEPPAA